MKRHSAYLILVPTLLLAACQQTGEESTQTEALAVQNDLPVTELAEESADASAMKAPGIPASAAPNLAFEYRYAFKLPDDKIGAVQEEHAEACEVLGSARCQIVDYRYAQAKENDVDAMLAFKLDPAIARKFGRDAIASVEKAEGVLADGNVTGTNVGGAIEDSQGRSALLQAQLERLELRLKAKLPAKERSGLQDRAEEIRRELDNEADGRSKGEVKLAMTPVQFTYTSDGGVPGFGKDNPFATAFDVSANSFATMISFVLMLAGALAPWALLLFLIVLALRSSAARNLRKLWNRSKPLTEGSASD
jgi:Domain of unknown function (DUF4349)